MMSAALVAIGLGYFMVILDATIVNVALPALRAGLHTSLSGLQWVVDGYTLVFAGALLTGGAAGDRFGARRVFQTGLGVFVAASVGCALAPSVAALVGARLAQGVGAALVVPSSLALLAAAYPDSRARARAVGVWGGIAGIAAAAGPVLGGLLVAAASWRLVFVVNLPIGIVAMVLAARSAPAPRPRPRSLDPLAQLTVVVALGALTAGLIEGGHLGWTSPLALAVFALAAVSGMLFVAVERRVGEPMLPLGLFANRTFSAATAVGLFINLGFYGQLFVINLYFQQVLGYSALIAGLALLPEAGVVSAAALASGRFTARVGGPRATMLVGLLTGAAGLAGLAQARHGTPYPILIPALVAAGFGMAFTMPAATTAVVDAVPTERAGTASGLINTARQVGGVIGVALLGNLIGTKASFVPGLRIALLVAAAAFLAGAIATAIAIER